MPSKIGILKELLPEDWHGDKRDSKLYAEIDQYVADYKENEDPESLLWIIRQFLYLLLRIKTQRQFFKIDKTFKKVPYSFFGVKKEDEEDLLSEMIIIIPKLIKEYDWSCKFNYYLTQKLEWTAINYWMRIIKRDKIEVITSDVHKKENLSASDYDFDDDIDICNRSSKNPREDQGVNYTYRPSVREKAEGLLLSKRLDEFVDKNFNETEKIIYNLKVRRGLTISQIAQHFGHKHHSRISRIYSDMSIRLQEFISKIDEEYDGIYEKLRPYLNRPKSELSSNYQGIDKSLGVYLNFNLPFNPSIFSKANDNRIIVFISNNTASSSIMCSIEGL